MESPQLTHADGRSVPPEFVGNAGRVRLVVLAAEVGGRLSCETLKFVKLVANAKSPSFSNAAACPVLLSCAAARAHALFLLERRPVSGLDGVAALACTVATFDHLEK